MKLVRCLCFLLVFCLSFVGIRAETETPPEPLLVENINQAALELDGWTIDGSGITDREEPSGVRYYERIMVTDKPEPKLIFKRRQIVAESVVLISPLSDSYPSTYEHFIYPYNSEQPAATIVRGKELYGEKRTYIALRRKDSWEFYSMRPEIKWHLEFGKNAEPEFAVNIRFD